ncbi:NAD(P)/FAD-dependent oxidoreductase [Algihabitans albus]|uniref:NAD(P)/FAD-dependent oxidoreductase n=1 Tax=Algihabitans albus TaxID=2164067 RepID=UPI000E5C6628|nr:FAD-dependent oxidoreductase [Algihabitans albus]
MSRLRTAVIVGAGQAGGRTAAQLRKQGWQDRILLLGEEADPPYERPPLSKEVLTQAADPLTGRLYAPEWYQENDVELRLACQVAALDLADRTLTLATGGRESWDVLVLATGCRARRLDCPGADLAGVTTLRTAADARTLSSGLQAGAEVVLVGGGFIGLELAASAAARGCSVTLLEARPQLLERALPNQLSDFLAARHRREGVELRLGVGVVAFEGEEKLQGLRLSDGSRLSADLAVIGVGALPNVELAQAAGLACQDGILVDSHCSAGGSVYALGDCSRHQDAWLGRPVRLESWENAERAPQAAAGAILDRPEPYGGVPWFWTDQYDVNLQLLGLKQPLEREVLRGDPESGSFLSFGLAGERVVTAALVNAGRERRPVKQLMEGRIPLDADALADPDVPLKQLTKGG